MPFVTEPLSAARRGLSGHETALSPREQRLKLPWISAIPFNLSPLEPKVGKCYSCEPRRATETYGCFECINLPRDFLTRRDSVAALFEKARGHVPHGTGLAWLVFVWHLPHSH